MPGVSQKLNKWLFFFSLFRHNMDGRSILLNKTVSKQLSQDSLNRSWEVEVGNFQNSGSIYLELWQTKTSVHTEVYSTVYGCQDLAETALQTIVFFQKPTIAIIGLMALWTIFIFILIATCITLHCIIMSKDSEKNSYFHFENKTDYLERKLINKYFIPIKVVGEGVF